MFDNRMDSLPKGSLTGKLLVASPFTHTGFPFAEAVVLVLQDTPEGVFGVVLNRPASSDMLVAWEEAIGAEAPAEARLVSGGPVQGPIMAIHRKQELAGVELRRGLFVSVQKTAIDKLNRIGSDESDLPFRIVMGAINWPEDQLQQEVDNGFWFVHDAKSDLVFSEAEDLWLRSVLSCGDSFIMDLAGMSELPAYPSLN